MEFKIVRTKLEADDYELHFNSSIYNNGEVNNPDLSTKIRVKLTNLYDMPLVNEKVTLNLTEHSKGSLGDKGKKKVTGYTNAEGIFETTYHLKEVFWGLETITCNRKRIQLYIDGVLTITIDKVQTRLFKDIGEYRIHTESYGGGVSLTSSRNSISSAVTSFQRTTVTFFSFSWDAVYLVFDYHLYGQSRNGNVSGNEYTLGIFGRKYLIDARLA